VNGNLGLQQRKSGVAAVWVRLKYLSDKHPRGYSTLTTLKDASRSQSVYCWSHRLLTGLSLLYRRSFTAAHSTFSLPTNCGLLKTAASMPQHPQLSTSPPSRDCNRPMNTCASVFAWKSTTSIIRSQTNSSHTNRERGRRQDRQTDRHIQGHRCRIYTNRSTLYVTVILL